MKKVKNLADIDLIISNNWFIYKNQSQKLSYIDFLSTPLIDVMSMIKKGVLFYTMDY